MSPTYRICPALLALRPEVAARPDPPGAWGRHASSLLVGCVLRQQGVSHRESSPGRCFLERCWPLLPLPTCLVPSVLAQVKAEGVRGSLGPQGCGGQSRWPEPLQGRQRLLWSEPQAWSQEAGISCRLCPPELCGSSPCPSARQGVGLLRGVGEMESVCSPTSCVSPGVHALPLASSPLAPLCGQLSPFGPKREAESSSRGCPGL